MNQLKPYERNVFYYETDKMGVVHHSNYIRIFDETRVWLLKQAGIPYSMIEELGILMHTLSVECKYKKPLVFDEPFAVYAIMTKYNGTSLEMDYRIVSRKTGEISALGHSVHCFTDMDMKPIRTRNKYPDLYNTFLQYVNYDPAEHENEQQD